MMSLIVPIVTFAADYRGFFETGVVYKSQKQRIYRGTERTGLEEGQAVIELGTTHGVQINKFLFLGGGANLNLQFDDYETLQSCNIFGAIRYDLCIEKKWSPFVNIKIGYSIKQYDCESSLISTEGDLLFSAYNSQGNGHLVTDKVELLPLYFNISLGTRLRLSSKCGLNLSLNYSPIILKNKEYSGTYSTYTDKVIDHGWWVENVMSEQISYEHAKPNLKTGHLFGFNIGIDF